MNCWIYILVIPAVLVIIFSLLNRKYSFIKDTSQFWKLSIGDIIQLLILASIAYSAIIMQEQAQLTNKSIDEQKSFNKNTLRPWVFLDLTEVIQIRGSKIILPYEFSNSGYSPAFEVFCAPIVTLHAKYPEAEIAEQLKSKTPFFIYPSNEFIGGVYEIDLTSLLPNLDTETKIIKYNYINPLFFHSYIKYKDSGNNNYYLKSSWGFKIHKDENNKTPDIRFIYSSLDSINPK